MNKVIFLVSGSGGNLKFLFFANDLLNLGFEIALVIADRDCDAIRFASDKNIPNKIVKYKQSNSDEIDNLLLQHPNSYVVTNIHKILSPLTLTIPDLYFINLHYSLLPAFSGLIGMEPVNKAKELNISKIGATCHKVIEEVDAGPILGQASFNADWNKDINIIYDCMFKSAAILLLDSLHHLNNHASLKLNSLNLNNFDVSFSPELCMDYSLLFDKDIWNLVSNS